MNKKQGDQIQLSPRKKKTVEKGKWIQNQPTYYNSRRIVLKKQANHQFDKKLFHLSEKFSASSNLPQYKLTSYYVYVMRLIQIKKNKKKTHTQWYGFFSLSEKIVLRQVFIASGFQSIVLALFQFNDDGIQS